MLAQNLNLDLMPFPESIEIGKEKFRLTENFKLSFSGPGERLQKASLRFLERLSSRTGLFLEFPFPLSGQMIEEAD